MVQTKYYDYKGQKVNIYQLANLSGLKPNTIRYRLKHMSVEEAIENPYGHRYNIKYNENRRNKLYCYMGQEYTAQEICDLTGTSLYKFKKNIENGMSVEEAVKKKNIAYRSNSKFYYFEGKEYTVKELSERFGISYNTVYQRLRSGFSIEESISLYKLPQRK